MTKKGRIGRTLAVVGIALFLWGVLPALPAGAVENQREWNLYFGQLHAHTAVSDGEGSVEEAFQYAAQVEGLDFFAVTDHSNSFEADTEGCITEDGNAVSSDWAEGKKAAASVTNEEFVGIFGYEMTWRDNQNLGHINTFNTPGWQSVHQDEFDTLESYFEALCTVPGSISQFNHPGKSYGEFLNFTNYDPRYDNVVQLLEVGSEGGYTAYEYYEKALACGWHVAPTNNQNNHHGNWGNDSQARTVVLAKELTEEALYDAMRNHRVYASEDADFSIYYTLGGHIMGSVLREMDDPVVTVSLEDPTNAIGVVEVVAGETVVESREMDGFTGELTVSVPQGYGYYYIRVLREGRIMAVTAPVWVEELSDFGISGFSADRETIVQGQEFQVNLEVFNKETLEISVERLEISVNGQVVHSADRPGTVPAFDCFSYSLPLIWGDLGETVVKATVWLDVEGLIRQFQAEFTVYVQYPPTIGEILVDGGHGNVEIQELGNLKTVAAEAGMGVTILDSWSDLVGSVLILPNPTVTYTPSLVTNAAQFALDGGTLILCGGAENSGELNRVLEAAGATMRFHSDTAVDPVNNGGSADALFPTVFNTDSQWCAEITRDQFYSQHSGCTIDAGDGVWLVKNRDDVLLAWEALPGGGKIFAAGSFFLTDTEMPLPANRWDIPRGNLTILRAILGVQQPEDSGNTIREVYSGGIGTVYQVEGYVTAGNSCQYNTFPDTIYLQDATGGIAVVDFPDIDVQVGTHMKVTGQLNLYGSNAVLELIRYELTGADGYVWDPQTIANETAMDYGSHGGELLQVQGQVVDVTLTADGKGVSRFVVKDLHGDTAAVVIEEGIGSARDGTNLLASQVQYGRTVRARGLLWLDGQGHPALRVRNCEEVVYVPSAPDPTNPKTGDIWWFLLGK